jgi:DNA polymerase III epsilon subunit-like protein
VTALAFVDCETTGLDPGRHEVWEVALILRRDKRQDDEHVWRLPVDQGSADAVALTIGRFYDRHGQVWTDLRPFATEFARLTHGAHLVGAVPSFDDAFLKRLLRANGACPGWRYHLIDVEALAAGWLYGTFGAIQEVGKNPEADGPTQEEAMRALPPWKSDDLSRAVGVDPDEFDRHTALGDARWAKAIYDVVLGR